MPAITRILTPTKTRDGAPSHSPPDTRYAPGLALARALGWFSIGLGVAEVLAPRQMSRMTGIDSVPLLQAYGVREIATGIGILRSQQPAGWMWMRVAGDAVDLATLGDVVLESNSVCRSRALCASAAVLGVTALDALAAVGLSAAAALEG